VCVLLLNRFCVMLRVYHMYFAKLLYNVSLEERCRLACDLANSTFLNTRFSSLGLAARTQQTHFYTRSEIPNATQQRRLVLVFIYLQRINKNRLVMSVATNYLREMGFVSSWSIC